MTEAKGKHKRRFYPQLLCNQSRLSFVANYSVGQVVPNMFMWSKH